MATFIVTAPFQVEADDAEQARERVYEAIAADGYWKDRREELTISLAVVLLCHEISVASLGRAQAQTGGQA